MENTFQTSFIPKKPINTSGISERRPTSLITVISIIILLVVGVSAGGLFIYKNYLNKQKEVLSTSLQKIKDSFEKDTIDELDLYDKRVSAAKQVLSNHIVLSPMFKLLGELTIPEIQYTKFDHINNERGFMVKMSGVATDYKSIASQADILNSAKGRSFKNVVFSNLVKDKSNKVIFDLEFTVEPSLLSYEKNVLIENEIDQTLPVSEKENINTDAKQQDETLSPSDDTNGQSLLNQDMNNKTQ